MTLDFPGTSWDPLPKMWRELQPGPNFTEVASNERSFCQGPRTRVVRVVRAATALALGGVVLVLGALLSNGRAAEAAGSLQGDEVSPRELTLFDPCFIKGPCYKGVIWFPGAEFRGPGWYCKDRLDVKKTDLIDECHIVAPCFYGTIWTGKRWECAAEDKKKVVKKYEDLMQKLLKGPHRGDKLWAIKELDSELPKLPTSCPERGYKAPKKCRMIGMDHGNLMLMAKWSSVLFDLVVCEDPEMRGRAAGVLYNIVNDHKENQKRLLEKMGGVDLLVAHLNPERNTSKKISGKALFGMNMLASECKAQSPDLCDFFPALTQMSSSGLATLVWNPPKGTGWQLQVALQEAWVSSCTVKPGMPSEQDFQACGGKYVQNLTNATDEQVYATLQSLQSLLKEDLWKQKYLGNFAHQVKPFVHKLPSESKLVAKKLLI